MWAINPVSKQLEATFQGELVSVSEKPQSNSNGTEFRVGSVKLPTGKTVSCRIYEKNFSHGMSIGTSYRCTATQYTDATGNPGIDVTMSHLTQAARASVDDFAFVGEDVATPANVGTADLIGG